MIKIPYKDVQECFNFAELVYGNEQDKISASPKQFGREFNRDKNSFIADHVVGKAVEYGFKYFLEKNYNISFNVDLRVWEDQHIHDEGNDLSTVIIDGIKRNFPYKTDIKGSRKSSLWLLIERHKILMFKTQIYVLGILNLDQGNGFRKNPYKYLDETWNVTIKGYAFNKELIDKNGQLGWFQFKKGHRLYNPYLLDSLKQIHGKCSIEEFHIKLEDYIRNKTNSKKFIGPPLDCNMNFGLPISWLRNKKSDWDHFVRIMKEKSYI